MPGNESKAKVESAKQKPTTDFIYYSWVFLFVKSFYANMLCGRLLRTKDSETLTAIYLFISRFCLLVEWSFALTTTTRRRRWCWIWNEIREHPNSRIPGCEANGSTTYRLLTNENMTLKIFCLALPLPSLSIHPQHKCGLNNNKNDDQISHLKWIMFLYFYFKDSNQRSIVKALSSFHLIQWIYFSNTILHNLI